MQTLPEGLLMWGVVADYVGHEGRHVRVLVLLGCLQNGECTERICFIAKPAGSSGRELGREGRMGVMRQSGGSAASAASAAGNSSSADVAAASKECTYAEAGWV